MTRIYDMMQKDSVHVIEFPDFANAVSKIILPLSIDLGKTGL